MTEVENLSFFCQNSLKIIVIVIIAEGQWC